MIRIKQAHQHICFQKEFVERGPRISFTLTVHGIKCVGFHSCQVIQMRGSDEESSFPQSILCQSTGLSLSTSNPERPQYHPPRRCHASSGFSKRLGKILQGSRPNGYSLKSISLRKIVFALLIYFELQLPCKVTSLAI